MFIIGFVSVTIPLCAYADDETMLNFEKPVLAAGTYAINANGHWMNFKGGPVSYMAGPVVMVPLEKAAEALCCEVRNGSNGVWTISYKNITFGSAASW